MHRLKTFIHQKRFFQREEPVSSRYSRSHEKELFEDDWEGTIDHRKVEIHRIKWQKRFDRVVYLVTVLLIVYTVYQWLAT